MNLLVEPGLVSTIIPVFNREEMIVDAVESVLAQTHRPIEILIVDDGSTDNTPIVLLQLSEDYPEVKVLTQSNSGPGVAREHGRLNARGEYIQYLDSDDLLLPNKFTEQIKALNENPDADVAYGMTESINIHDEPKGIPDGFTGHNHESMFPLSLRERWWSTSTPLFRRSVTEAAGPWSNASNEEDWEYDCRIASLGGSLAFTNTMVSITRRHGSHLSTGGAHLPEKLRNRALSRAKIFQHAKRYMVLDSRPSDITQEDWVFFSKYAFLLARQCAIAGLKTEARAMLSVSIEANGKKSVQHRLFVKLVTLMGWRNAANLVEWVKR